MYSNDFIYHIYIYIYIDSRLNLRTCVESFPFVYNFLFPCLHDNTVAVMIHTICSCIRALMSSCQSVVVPLASPVL